MRSLIRALTSRLDILWLLSYWLNTIWSILAEQEAAETRPSLHLSKYQIVGNLISRLICKRLARWVVENLSSSGLIYVNLFNNNNK